MLTANFQNGEDSIQRPGALREDMQGLGFFGSGIITPAVTEFGASIDDSYASAVRAYNTYIRSLAPVFATLQSAGLKAPSARTITP